MREDEVTEIKDPMQRSETVLEIQPNVRLDIPFSTQRELGLDPNILVESTLLNTWLLPSRERNNRILAQGDYRRKIVSSATIPITDHFGNSTGIDIDVVSKPVEDYDLAMRELQALEDLHTQTDVRGILPFAVMRVDDPDKDKQYVYLLTRLEKGVIPLQNLKIEAFLPDQKEEFLKELGEFTAHLANQGVIHNDLMPRNIFYELTQNPRYKSNFGLFDMEMSRIVPRNTLIAIRARNIRRPQNAQELMDCAKIAEGFLGDAADLAEQLMLTLPAQIVRNHYAISYLKHRLPITCQYSDDESLEYIMRSRLRSERPVENSA